MLHVIFCYNLNIKQMLLHDEVIKGLHATKQGINIHAKAYKVIVMQYKAKHKH